MTAQTETIRAAVIRRLWERMTAVYGFRWASAYGEAAEVDGRLTLAADTWQRGLAGLPERAIGTGLDTCIASAEPWPPTLPQFRAMCFAVPSLHRIRAELRTSTGERTAFALMVLGELDLHLYRRVEADRAERMLVAAYEAARERVMRGEPLPEPRQALAHQPEARAPASEETARAHLDAMREAFLISPEALRAWTDFQSMNAEERAAMRGEPREATQSQGQ